MRVSELAERVGTTAKTIRFYEAEGVLPTFCLGSASMPTGETAR